MSRSNATAVISLDDYRRRRESARCRVEAEVVTPPMPPASVTWVPMVWVVGWWMSPTISGYPG